MSSNKVFRSKRVTKINDNERIGGGVKGREGKGGGTKDEVKPRGFNHHRETLFEKSVHRCT